jgi:sortase A
VLTTRLIARAGRLFVGTGVLVLLFVVYQLWGTGLQEARSQDALEREFNELIEHFEVSTTSTTTTTAPGTETTRPPAEEATDPENRPAVPIRRGDAIARLQMPTIGVDKFVVQGTSTSALRKGPGHYQDTPLPGMPGNSGIAGHRTTYGAPFGDIDKLAPGDPIVVTTVQGRFTYQVLPGRDNPAAGHFIVKPTDVWVLDDVGDTRLTLTACHPKYSARQRIIVAAVLVESLDPSAITDASTRPAATRPPVTQVMGATETARPLTQFADGDEDGLSGDSSARGPAILWGLVFLGLLSLVWQASIRWRRWPCYAIGAVPLAVVLFLWFEQIDRWLPAR